MNIKGEFGERGVTDRDSIPHTLVPSTQLPTLPGSHHLAVRNKHISYVPFALSSYCISYQLGRLDVRVMWIVLQPMRRLVSRLGHISVSIAAPHCDCCNPLWIRG